MAVKPKLPVATAEQFEGMTLMRLRTEYVGRVRLIDITFDQDVTVIGGDNFQGKSSYLNSLHWCFGDKSEIKVNPINDEKQQGTIYCEFGDGQKVALKVTCELRRVGDDGWQREYDIEIPDHIPPSRVAEFMRKLSGLHAFDPLEFDKAAEDKKFEALRGLVGDFDFKANAAARKKLYDERTDVGKDRDREYGAANGITVAEAAPGKRVDEDALTAELKAVGEHNTLLERRQANRSAVAENVRKLRDDAQAKLDQIARDSATAKANHDSRIEDLQAQIKALQDRIASATTEFQEELVQIRTRLTGESEALTKQADAEQRRIDEAEPLPAAKDGTDVEQRLKQARETNAAIDEWQRQKDRRAKHLEDGNVHAKTWEDLAAKIAELDHERQQAIAKAHLPLEGLGFGDGYITLNGRRWAEASRAEAITASTAIAMALSPMLKVMLIRDGSNLGSGMRNIIRQMAHERGYRVLLEIVDESGANSHVFIEDGMVKSIDGQRGAA